MNDLLFEFDGDTYPDYLRRGNAVQFFLPFAKHFCRGRGLDVGCGDWPIEGAEGVDMKRGGDAMALPAGPWDFIASSHCLEHVIDPVGALLHWKDVLRPGGVLALYLPHPDQKYWRPTRCRKHLHAWRPADMAQTLRDLGFVDVIHSERDLAWSFASIAFKAE